MWCSDWSQRTSTIEEISWNGVRYRVTAPYSIGEIPDHLQSIEGWISLVNTAGITCEDSTLLETDSEQVARANAAKHPEQGGAIGPELSQ